MTHYNTTNVEGAELREFKSKAARQTNDVLAYFRDRAWRGFSPSQVHRGMKTLAPLTSIRRAITDLTLAGLLVKTDEQCDGPYGRREHKWKLVTPATPVQERLL